MVSGFRISGGTLGESNRVIVPEQLPGNGNNSPHGNQAVILKGMVSLTPSTGNGSDLLDVTVRVVSRHVGESDRYFSKAVSVNLWFTP
jgi:hypothetical protein